MKFQCFNAIDLVRLHTAKGINIVWNKSQNLLFILLKYTMGLNVLIDFIEVYIEKGKSCIVVDFCKLFFYSHYHFKRGAFRYFSYKGDFGTTYFDFEKKRY